MISFLRCLLPEVLCRHHHHLRLCGEPIPHAVEVGCGGLSSWLQGASLEFNAAVIQDDELVTLTPAFDAGTTEYTASVAYRFAYASIENIVRGDSAALVVVSDEVGSHDLGTDDFVEGLELAVGENTFPVS